MGNANRVIVGLCPVALSALMPLPALCAELINAEQFAERCSKAQGHLAIVTDLHVEGGATEIAECRVTLGAARLDIRDAEFAATGFFMIEGQPNGDLRVERSVLIQSAAVNEPVNVLLRAHQLRLHATTIDFLGTVHLETGAADRGELQVEGSLLRSLGGDIHIGSSGRGREGNTVVKHSELIASADGISILASAQAPHGAGRIHVEENSIVSAGTIAIQTGEDGRTKVSRNSRVSEQGSTGIHAGTTLSIVSGEAGETTVDQNRIVADEDATILSGGRTRALQNDFVGIGDITIAGPRCVARRNLPEVACSD